MSERRRALTYVVNALNAGGTEKLVVEMSLAFSSEYDINVICLDEPGVWAEELRRGGIEVQCLWRQPGLDLSIPFKLARLFKASGTAIVHAHQCTPWFYSALARLLSPSPRLLLEEHGRFYPETENRTRAFVNRHFIKRLTHRFVAVSRDIRSRLAQYEGLSEEQIEVIYNGVAAPREVSALKRQELRAQLGFGPGDFLVGAIGRFDPIKNLPMLIDALARVRSRSSNVRAMLVGHGPMFSEVSQLLVERGLGKDVLLTGFRNDARDLIRCLDLYVLCSFSEGTSMALLEAMAAGVPVAVTAVGGNPEIVQNGLTGWVVPSGAVDALAAAIEEANKDQATRSRFAIAGQKRFQEHFSFDHMIGQYRRLYRTVLNTWTDSEPARGVA